ncbi:MAG: DNA cytosine methyltransferase [Lachnospiraceae bacterium]|nr:DNA cytosine methyltransferase [Lachnospiraceae bacterium]
MYTLNDFFCGCGGLGLGFQNAGFKIVGAWDFDKYAVQTYRENVGDHVVQADIQTLHIEDIPKADAWAFGFPCQDLSVAGKQAGLKLECMACGEKWEVNYDDYTGENVCPVCGGTETKAGSRSGMFFEIMRLIEEARERAGESTKSVNCGKRKGA